jgi:hypothetical protein
MQLTMKAIFCAANNAAKMRVLSGTLGLGALVLSAYPAAAQSVPALLPFPPPVVSTVPSIGDVNPYGVAFVPNGFPTNGKIQTGDILVSNFNNAQNLQGTGTTIVRVAPNGQTSTFYGGPAGLGLTAALGVVRHGLVFVGSLPTTDGTSNTIGQTSLLVINNNGVKIGQLTNSNVVNGPWGMAINDLGAEAQIFISNVLSGTVVRLDVAFSADNSQVFLRDAVRIASGYSHRTDPAALVLGPSGLAYDAANDLLYVASSADNAVFAVPYAGNTTNDNGTGSVIYQDNTHLHGPLDLVLAPNGHLLVANSDGSNVDPNQPSEIVEFTTTGTFVNQYSVDKNNGGAFGIGLEKIGPAVKFAAVDDNQNTLSIFTTTMK